MKPVNAKSLFSHVCEQMRKLDNQEIKIEEAKEQANLVKQANNLLKYELDRAKIELKLSEHKLHHDVNIELRQIESKSFD